MKKILFVLFLLFSTFIYSQNLDAYTARQVSKIAVFPGCEKFTTNEELVGCLSKSLNKQLEKNLNRDIEYFLSLRMENLVTKIQFVISNEGEFKDFESLGGNHQLSVRVVDIFNKFIKNIRVTPAYIENNEPVNLIFLLPVKYSFYDIWNKELSIFELSNTPELVYLTINDQDKTYEIRMKKDTTFSIYEVGNGNEEFLGNVPNWSEFQNMEPFAQFINKYLNEQQWELVTEGELNGEKFRIYRWSYDLEYVRVYKLVDDEEVLVLKSNRFNKFLKSPYIKMLERN